MNSNLHNSEPASGHTAIKMAADPRLFRRKYARPPDRKLTIGFYESASVLLIIFIIAGSLYPFEFDWSLTASRLQGVAKLPGKSDLIANLGLFIPLGFAAGMIRRLPVKMSFLVAALTVAIGCQFVQIYLPGRTPAVWDFLLNSVGLTVGLLLTRFVYHPTNRTESKVSLASFIAIAAFLGYHLAPFAPSLDFDLLKEAIRRLLETPTADLGSFLMGSAYVFLIAGALKAEIPFRNANRILIGVVGAVIVLKPITAAAYASIAGLIGMLLALYPACKMPANRWVFGGLAVLALLLYVHDGLTPFIVRAELNFGDLSPLVALVGGSWLANITALLWKSFLLIAAISLLFGALGNETRKPAMVIIGSTILVESSQILVASGTPTTADVFLALALSAAFFRSVRSGSHHIDGYGRNHRMKQTIPRHQLIAELSKSNPPKREG